MQILSKSINNEYFVAQLNQKERETIDAPFVVLRPTNGENSTIKDICHKGSSIQDMEKFVSSKMKKFKYSIIAIEYLRNLDEEEPKIKHTTISWGNTQMMEDLFVLFGGDRNDLRERTKCIGHHYRFKYVMDKLDRESHKENAIFEKGFIHYNGIINRPTRCFTLKMV